MSGAGLLIGVSGAAFYLHNDKVGLGALIVLLLFMAVIVWALPKVKRWSFAVTVTPLVIGGLLTFVVWYVLGSAPGATAGGRDRVIAFLLQRPTLVGCALGAMVASVVWAVVTWLRARRLTRWDVARTSPRRP